MVLVVTHVCKQNVQNKEKSSAVCLHLSFRRNRDEDESVLRTCKNNTRHFANNNTLSHSHDRDPTYAL